MSATITATDRRRLIAKTWSLSLTLLVVAAACGRETTSPAAPGTRAAPQASSVSPATETIRDGGPAAGAKIAAATPRPPIVVGRHVIIAFADSALGTIQTRTKAAAEALATATAERVRKGESIERLVNDLSDDPMKSVDFGLRRIRDFGVTESGDEKSTPRGAIPAYADALFELAVGDVTIVAYDPPENDLGWIVLQRVE